MLYSIKYTIFWASVIYIHKSITTIKITYLSIIPQRFFIPHSSFSSSQANMVPFLEIYINQIIHYVHVLVWFLVIGIIITIHSILLLSGLPLYRCIAFIYTLTCSSCCGYYYTCLCVNICFHFFWVKTQREELDCVGVFNKQPNCFPKALHYFTFLLAV